MPCMGKMRAVKSCWQGRIIFCLRDEFCQCRPQSAAGEVKNLLLITFGGVPTSTTAQGASWILWSRFCRERGIAIRIVAGPGYAHREAMEKHLAERQSAGGICLGHQYHEPPRWKERIWPSARQAGQFTN